MSNEERLSEEWDQHVENVGTVDQTAEFILLADAKKKAKQERDDKNLVSSFYQRYIYGNTRGYSRKPARYFK